MARFTIPTTLIRFWGFLRNKRYNLYIQLHSQIR